MTRPDLLLLDVNETLSDLRPLSDVFVGIGLAREQAATWFASVLREGFAVTVRGGSVPFAEIGRSVAGDLLRAADADPEGAEAVIEAFQGLAVHPDVPVGLTALADAGVRLVTLSNGSAAVAEGLLERSGLTGVVERVLSVEDAGVWKPDARAYHWALQECDVDPVRAALAAVHPWDVAGARDAGLGGVLVDRGGVRVPTWLPSPDLVVTGFDDLARTWA